MTPHREAALAEAWKRTLGGIPSMLGRLSYLANLRNANTGAYEHMGLAQRYGEAEADKVLRRSHEEVFREWLNYSLHRQKQELEEYMDELPGDKKLIVAHWLSIEPYAVWIPVDSRPVERKLFYSDLEMVLELIRNDFDAASRGRDS